MKFGYKSMNNIFRNITLLTIVGMFLTISPTFAYQWRNTGGLPTVYDSDRVVGRVETVVSQGINSKYSVKKSDNNTFCLTFRFKAVDDVDSARIELSFVRNDSACYWMIPSVSYNGNHWGRGGEPKGAADENGQWRSYSYRRTPIPCLIYSETHSYAVATWTAVPHDSQSDISCSARPSSSQMAHTLIWPEEEMPTCYFDRDNFKPGYQRCSSIKKGDVRTIVLYVSITPVLPEHRAMATFLKTCWQMSESPKFNTSSPQTIWQQATTFVKNSLWAEEDYYRGFSIGLVPDGDRWKQRPFVKYEAGWCGQNISLANSLLYDYIRHADEESLNKAIATLDCWADSCTLPNGLFITHFDAKLEHRTNIILDACNLGTAALNYFQAYDLARQCGVERPRYRQLALDICSFVLNDQLDDGCYARGWTVDGQPYVRQGTVGCFMVPAMIEAYMQSNDERYLTSAMRAYDFYSHELMTDGYTTAGALDTWCIDKESAITLLRSSIQLFKLTLQERYLSDAQQISYYLSTWLWHYDGIYPPDDAFTKYSYHTFGSTSVSVQHHHLDPYALYWVPEWMELSRLTHDTQWQEKAMAIWNNGNQLLSDGTLVVNGRLRPVGSQNEAYFESNWCVSNPEHRINDWLVAWPCAFRLETLRKTSLFESKGM